MFIKNKPNITPHAEKRSYPRPVTIGGICLLIVCVIIFGSSVHHPGIPDANPPVTETPQFFALPPPSHTPEMPPESTALIIPDVKVRGLYVDGWSAGLPEKMSHFIELCNTTEINTLVIDIKDDRGQITFLSDTESVSDACVNIIPDIEEIMAELKSNNIYTIARVVCFKDPFWSRANPELSIRDKNGALWEDGGGNTWLDPYNTASWEYLADVSELAARLGFDEVQLDYVRFPTDGKLSGIEYGSAADEKTKAEIIDEFVAYIKNELSGDNVKLSADVFGIIALANGDFENIGQDLDLLIQSADCVSPMIYPSHYANKRQNGVGQRIGGVLFEAPDTMPYGVVYNTLLTIKSRLPEDGEYAVIRPYLQDFTAAYLGGGYYVDYGAEQVSEQIRAVYDAGFEEWILWNHSSNYSEEALEPAG